MTLDGIEIDCPNCSFEDEVHHRVAVTSGRFRCECDGGTANGRFEEVVGKIWAVPHTERYACECGCGELKHYVNMEYPEGGDFEWDQPVFASNAEHAVETLKKEYLALECHDADADLIGPARLADAETFIDLEADAIDPDSPYFGEDTACRVWGIHPEDSIHYTMVDGNLREVKRLRDLIVALHEGPGVWRLEWDHEEE